MSPFCRAQSLSRLRTASTSAVAPGTKREALRVESIRARSAGVPAEARASILSYPVAGRPSSRLTVIRSWLLRLNSSSRSR